MGGLKSLFRSKSSKENVPGEAADSSSSKNPFHEPALTPGFYGQFPPSFSIHLDKSSGDKKTAVYFLASEGNGQLRPLNALTINARIVKVQIKLYPGLDPNAIPIGIAGIQKYGRSTHTVALPALLSEGVAATNRIEPLDDKKSWKFAWFGFTSLVGPAGSAEKRSEEFEWRSDNILKPPKDKPFERTLVRMKSPLTGSEEVVGTWTDVKGDRGTGSKLGTFYFKGSGATGELGEYWALHAVMTLLRLQQISWGGEAAANDLIKGAGALTSFGLSFI